MLTFESAIVANASVARHKQERQLTYYVYCYVNAETI